MRCDGSRRAAARAVIYPGEKESLPSVSKMWFVEELSRNKIIQQGPCAESYPWYASTITL
jgi:hypothetical protein